MCVCTYIQYIHTYINIHTNTHIQIKPNETYNEFEECNGGLTTSERVRMYGRLCKDAVSNQFKVGFVYMYVYVCVCNVCTHVCMFACMCECMYG
jgi:hypothetical protein